MADPAVISVLAILHVVFAVSWLGGVGIYVSSVAPGVTTMTPRARIEFGAKVGPRLVRFFGVAGTLTLVFGLGLLFELFGSNYSAWPTTIEIGFTMGLLAYIVALTVTVPSSVKVGRMAKQMLNDPNQGPPSEEFARSFRKLDMGTYAISLLLLLAAIFMVGTAFPW